MVGTCMSPPHLPPPIKQLVCYHPSSKQPITMHA